MNEGLMGLVQHVIDAQVFNNRIEIFWGINPLLGFIRQDRHYYQLPE